MTHRMPLDYPSIAHWLLEDVIVFSLFSIWYGLGGHEGMSMTNQWLIDAIDVIDDLSM